MCISGTVALLDLPVWFIMACSSDRPHGCTPHNPQQTWAFIHACALLLPITAASGLCLYWIARRIWNQMQLCINLWRADVPACRHSERSTAGVGELSMGQLVARPPTCALSAEYVLECSHPPSSSLVKGDVQNGEAPDLAAHDVSKPHVITFPAPLERLVFILVLPANERQ